MSPDTCNHHTQRLLIVDDEETMCELLQFNLQKAGYIVDTVLSAEDAMRRDLSIYDLFILDIVLGHMSGLELAKLLKENKSTADTPIIFCSARNNVDDIVNGLNIGADDYITKPFSIKEMEARVRSVLRRKAIVDAHNNQLSFETLKIDTIINRATIDGHSIALTRTEMDMLTLFMRHPNRFFSRNEIFENVWPEQVIVIDRTVDVNISRMRKKLGRYAAHIINRPGIGYGFIDTLN